MDKVRNMESSRGNKVANQFIISSEGRGANGNFKSKEIFQSYNTVIAIRIVWQDGREDIELDSNSWDYSVTTGKYRNIFLDEKKPETEKKIKSGTYKLCNLNS